MELDRLRGKLEQVKGAWPKVADAVGVSTSWIHQFMNGRIAEPGHKKIQALEKWFKELSE